MPALRARPPGPRTWLFDLDNTLHDASHAAFGFTSVAMTSYIEQHLAMSTVDASRLRQHYWQRYGATLLGLVRHHGVHAQHFLDETHRMPGLESRLRCHAADRRAVARLPGRKYILTNGPRAYAHRVLGTLGLTRLFHGVLCIEDMRMFGQHRPKPDLRMLRHLLARLRCRAAHTVLVEDTLANLKSARALGMPTVWMQGYLGPTLAGRHHRKPPYVCARIGRIQDLRAVRLTPR